MCRFVSWVVIAAAAAASAAPQTMRERVNPDLMRALANGSSFVCVSAASGAPAIAPDSLASIFGPNLASQTAIGSAPYPLSLGGVSLQIVDSAGTTQMAQLLYVSPDQINYLAPAALASGMATLRITSGSNVISGSVRVQTVVPALFTANGDGLGVVAATAYRTVIPSNITSPVPVFVCGRTPGSCVSVPIDVGLDAPVTVTAYATGLRRRSNDSAVTLTIKNTPVLIRSITSFDNSNALAGVDQVTFLLPISLRGSGEVDIVLTVDGMVSNHARINIL